MIFKNVTDGPKVLNTLAGPVSVPAGAQSSDVEMSEAEQVSALATEWFEVIEAAATEALADMTVAELKALAEAEGIDLGDATKKADIVSAIELARESA